MTLLINVAIWTGVLTAIVLCVVGPGVAAAYLADKAGMPFVIVYFCGLAVAFGIFLGVLTTISA